MEVAWATSMSVAGIDSDGGSCVGMGIFTFGLYK
jgi:hypothetical protein